MSDINCESVRVAYMALADGEEVLPDREEFETHLQNCERCQAEIEPLRALNKLWSSHKRLRAQTDLWPVVSKRLEATVETAPSFSWRVLLLFGLPLFAYKLVLLIFQVAPSLWSKLVPVILAIAIFSCLKANPFKINCELTLRGELSS